MSPKRERERPQTEPDSKWFKRPRTAADLVATYREAPRKGEAIKPSWRWRYPEGFFRVTVAFPDAALLLHEDAELVRESSPLFWDPGTPAQILLWAAAAGVHWSLSLTRWGVLRWECRGKGAGDDAWVESYSSMSCLAKIDEPFCAAVTMARGGADGKWRVRLLAGAAGQPLVQLGENEMALPAGVERPRTLFVGQGPRGLRPMRARAIEVLAASTTLHPLYQGQWRGDTGVSTERPNASALASRLDERTVLAYPGVGLDSTAGNYWHHLTVTDPKIRSVRFAVSNGMSGRFFGSTDHREWFGLVGSLIAGEGRQGRGLEVALPRRRGVLHVANCPVYDEERREEDLAAAKGLGAVVHRAARSRGGLPVHVVELTNRAVALRGKIGVALICGQHSPVEQMTGFLGMPLMRELVRLNAADGPARGILDRIAFYWVPTFNVDCERRGLPGNTLDGENPNRHWFEGQGPEQKGVEDFFLERRRRGMRLGLMIDGHGGGVWRNHTVLADYHLDGDVVKKATAIGRLVKDLPFGPADRLKQAWFALLDRHAGLRERWENGVETEKMCRAPEWFQETFGCPGITIECSVVTQFDPATRRTREFTQAAYADVGRGLARAIAAGAGLLERGAGLLSTAGAEKRR